MRNNILHGLVVLTVLIGSATSPEVIAGQEVTAGTEERQLALGRICASEEGLSRETDGCAAIFAVISGAAERRQIPWMRQAREGSRQSFNLRRTDARRWIAFLNAEGTEPEGWPRVAWRRVLVPQEDGTEREMVQQVAHAAWSAPERRDDFRRRWLRIYTRAGRVVRGSERHQCHVGARRVEPHYWGCPPDQFTVGSCRDHERAERARWTRIECGDTRNWFYCDPRISSTCPRREDAVASESTETEEQLGG